MFDPALAFVRHCGAVAAPSDRPSWWRCAVCGAEFQWKARPSGVEGEYDVSAAPVDMTRRKRPS